MAHYALLDENNVVIQVITGRNENEIVDGISDWEAYYSRITGFRCVRTSFNHNIRKQYAAIGSMYDDDADVFIAPQPFPSWTLDENYDWQPPTPKPDESGYLWNEDELVWVKVDFAG